MGHNHQDVDRLEAMMQIISVQDYHTRMTAWKACISSGINTWKRLISHHLHWNIDSIYLTIYGEEGIRYDSSIIITVVNTYSERPTTPKNPVQDCTIFKVPRRLQDCNKSNLV